MDKQTISLFGLYYHESRNTAGISQWAVCRKVNYHPRNVQRMERGEQEPRISLAVQLVSALEINCGIFFSALAKKANIPHNDLAGTELPLPEKENFTFGKLLRYVRNHYGVTQHVLAEQTGYYLRNITKIENDRQEPRVMSALRLACATGCDINWFFDTLQFHYTRV